MSKIIKAVLSKLSCNLVDGLRLSVTVCTLASRPGYYRGSFLYSIYFIQPPGTIDPVGKLLVREKKSIMVIGTAPLPSCSFGLGYNSVNIVMI